MFLKKAIIQLVSVFPQIVTSHATKCPLLCVNIRPKLGRLGTLEPLINVHARLFILQSVFETSISTKNSQEVFFVTCTIMMACTFIGYSRVI